MGSDKASLALGDATMLEWVASALAEAGCEVIAVGNHPGDLSVPVHGDATTDRLGPAAGLATALRMANGRPVFLAATDQPFLRPATVRALLALDGAAVVPVDGSVRQATCAVYRWACGEPLAGLAAGAEAVSLQKLLDAVDAREVEEAEWSAWGEDGSSWWSIDTPEALTEARRRAAPR